MKTVDMSTVDLVHSGCAWTYGHPPCNKRMLRHLERNEDIVSWVQPKGGVVSDQYPVIRIGDSFFTMSLRMMKAVWRSVRLRKGFVNMEKAPFGGVKLRIPTLLFVEKMRTQSRFNLMRMESDLNGEAQSRERKVVHNASSKVTLVVKRMLFPLLDLPLRTHVVFDAEQDQAELDFIDALNKDHPEVMADYPSFARYLQGLYDRYTRGYRRVSDGSV